MGLRKPCLPICLLLLFVPARCRGAQNIQLVGVGSTTPISIYSLWFREFEKAHPNVHFSYIPSGSSDGVAMVSTGKADFGGTDAPMTNDQLAKAGVLQFPTVLGALVPVYNLPGVGPLKFSQRVLAGIYLGKIKRWNDPALVRLNPGTQMPARPIVVFHSAAGRGSAYVWSDFLSKVSEEWRTKVGVGTHIAWPTGTAADGNGNLADAVKHTPDSIGYVWFSYAVGRGLAYGQVQNAAGKFVTPDCSSVAVSVAAAAVHTMPADFRLSITNSPGERAYPIASFTWLLVPQRLGSAEKREAMQQFLTWVLSNGQSYAATTGFAPLPAALVAKELAAIKNAD